MNYWLPLMIFILYLIFIIYFKMWDKLNKTKWIKVDVTTLINGLKEKLGTIWYSSIFVKSCQPGFNLNHFSFQALYNIIMQELDLQCHTLKFIGLVFPHRTCFLCLTAPISYCQQIIKKNIYEQIFGWFLYCTFDFAAPNLDRVVLVEDRKHETCFCRMLCNVKVSLNLF